MTRRLTTLVALALAAGVAVAPAEAAPKPKPKPKPINFSYDVSLVPDPTGNATHLQGNGCRNLLPPGKNIRPFTVPAAGRLKITLVAPDPVGKGIVFDWDLYLMEKSGTAAALSNSEFAHELIDVKYKKKSPPLTIEVCQLSGLPATGKVTVNFVYA